MSTILQQVLDNFITFFSHSNVKRSEAILKIAVDIPARFVQQADDIEMAALGCHVERRGVLVRRNVDIDQWRLQQDLHDFEVTFLAGDVDRSVAVGVSDHGICAVLHEDLNAFGKSILARDVDRTAAIRGARIPRDLLLA